MASGRGITDDWSTRVTAPPTTIVFSRSASDGTEESKDKPTAGPEQDIVEMYSTSEKTADTDMSIA